MEVHWVEAGRTHPDNDFRDVLRRAILSSDSIDIVSGYVGTSSATQFGHHLVQCARRGGRVRILVGMAGTEGLAKGSHEAWSSIHEQLQEIDASSGVFAYMRKIHAKLYIFRNRDSNRMFVGSQNFNFSSGNMELMLESGLRRDVEQRVDSIFSDTSNLLPITRVNIKGTSSDPLTRKVTPAEIIHYDDELDYRGMQLVESINLRAICEKNPIGSLNLYHGSGRLNSTTGVYTPRPWYEVELTLGRDNYPGLPRDFRAFTDDGKIIEMQRRSGGPSGQPHLGLKDLTSKGNRQLFGEWIKGKLERAGALDVGDVIDGSTFDSYGSDRLEFYSMGEGEFYMRFGPKV